MIFVGCPNFIVEVQGLHHQNMVEGDETAPQACGGTDGVGLSELSGEHVDGMRRLDCVIHGSQLIMQSQVHRLSGEPENAQQRDQCLQLPFSHLFIYAGECRHQ